MGRSIGFPCPHCSSQSGVVNSDPFRAGVRRRRQCRTCGKRWTTYEIDLQNLLTEISETSVRRLRRDLLHILGVPDR